MSGEKQQKKLVLNKQTLRNLKDADLAGVAGGMMPNTALTQCADDSCAYTCGNSCVFAGC